MWRAVAATGTPRGIFSGVMPRGTGRRSLSAQPSKIRRALGIGAKLAAGTTLLAAGGIGALAAYDEGVRRTLRFTAHVTPVIVEYWWFNHKVGHLPQAEQDALKKPLHEKHRYSGLNICLELGGYYLKAGQMVVGMQLLPKQMEEELQTLQDNVPPRPFSEIRAIVEEELGCPLEEVYASFSMEPLGAASIGQTHRATLLDGTEVVVKVQYPDVETYFRLDIATCRFFMEKVYGLESNDHLNRVWDEYTESFESEFDYRKEAALMRRCSEHIIQMGRARLFKIPLPIDSQHPVFKALPESARGKNPDGSTRDGLCSKKLLTMELIEGESISAAMSRQLKSLAAAEGKTLQQFRRDLETKFMDPAERQKLVDAMPSSEAEFDRAIMVVRVLNFFRRLMAGVFNWTVGLIPGVQPVQAKELTVPLNGSRIMLQLFAIHAEMLFEHGIANADPHAGNIMVMDDGRLGLIDYGSVLELTEEKRVAYARYIIALSDENPSDEKIVEAFHQVGFYTKGQERLKAWDERREETEPEGLVAKLKSFIGFDLPYEDQIEV
eukprot:INCI555.1.p1 GENE.INCI555.1~~INCI555.1.p1  ORF type:complete len:551 (-),score=111.57 INCI555.1:127-1779(-)